MIDMKESERVSAEINAWNSSVPSFAVFHEKSVNLGRCYNGYHARIESRIKLTGEDIGKLRAAKVLGYGQEFYIHSDMTAEPEVKVYRFTPSGINPVGGKAYPEQTRKVFVYRVEDRVDSSD